MSMLYTNYEQKSYTLHQENENVVDIESICYSLANRAAHELAGTS